MNMKTDKNHCETAHYQAGQCDYHCTQQESSDWESKIREIGRQAGYEPNAWYEDQIEKYVSSLLQKQREQTLAEVEEKVIGENETSKLSKDRDIQEEVDLAMFILAKNTLRDEQRKRLAEMKK